MQIFAATCGPRGVTFWTLHESFSEGGRLRVRNEEGSLRHASEHSSDPMAICAHFLTTRMLVTGIAHFLTTRTLLHRICTLSHHPYASH